MFDCPGCTELRNAFGEATAIQFMLEDKLLSALSRHNHDSIVSITSDIEGVRNRRQMLRLAIQEHNRVSHQPHNSVSGCGCAVGA